MINVKYVSLFALMFLVSVGCSGPEQEVYPVELQVFVKGKPATGAIVTLHPINAAEPNATTPMGKVDESGTVRISTFAQNDGAPPGEYAITVTWHDVVVGPDQVKDLSPDKLRGRHNKPKDPSAPRVTVKKEPNKLPALQL